MSLQKQVSLHGGRVFLTSDDILVAKSGLAVGGDGAPSVVYGGPDTVSIFEDFLSKSISGIADSGFSKTHESGPYFQVVTADTGRNAALQQNFASGVLRLNPDGSGATTTSASSVMAIVGHTAAWKVNMGRGAHAGRLRFGCRIKSSGGSRQGTGESWNNSGIFVGFTDTGILAAAEMPYYDTGIKATTEATDTGRLHHGTEAYNCVGFYYGERSDTGWRGISASSGSTSISNDSGDQEVLLDTTLPAANRWYTLEVEIRRGQGDTGGTATFFIDGIPKGSITSPISTSVPLTPVIAMIVTDTGQGVLDIDWMAVSGPRDTGT